MADWDDGAPLQAPGEFTSDMSLADQSLRAAATATATGGSGSAEGRTSGMLKLEPGDSSTGTEELSTGTAASAPSEQTEEELERAALCLEITRVRQLLEEQDNEVEEANARDDVAATVVGNEDTDAIAYRVIDFDGGSYRGQVQAVNDAWQPHGFGVLTTASGHTCSGHWFNGTQVNHGTRYTPTLHYEGELGVGAVSCHGVGLYTFGALYVGCWNAAIGKLELGHLHPRGLGSLQRSTEIISPESVDGWFHGLRCTHPCPSEVDCIFQLSAGVRSQPQPQRGLMIADEKLQHWRKHALNRAMRRWTRRCWEFSIIQARGSRLLALQTQALARQAEQRAISEHVERQKAAKSEDATELLVILDKSREAQEQRSQRRQLYVQRLASATKQCDLARACVAKQESAVKTLELELREIADLLKEAQQAQEDSAQYARELHVLKRQIENASVKLNAARFAQQRQASSPQDQELEPCVSQRSDLSTPMEKTSRHRRDIEDNNHSVNLAQKFVCDSPGCACGIPRDVFVRVAAALNDE